MNDRLSKPLGLLEHDDKPKPAATSEKDKGAAPSTELATFSARLLGLVADTAVESDTLNTYEFRGKLEKYRHRLANSVNGDPNTTLVAGECLRLCQDYLTRARTYLLDRETEFAEVIDVLRLALGKLAGEAQSFNVRLMGSSERFNRLTEIQDIREMKKQISQEVRELNRVVVEKQKQDEASYSRLSRRIEVLQTNLSKTKEEAALDPLTRVANRGSFDAAIERWVNTHRQTGKPFVVAMLDLDNFKQINDTHGHQVGDRILLSAAQRFGKHVRGSDFLARYGGEEFVIMMSELDLVQAESKFQEILVRIASCSHEYSKDGQDFKVCFTASCGLAEFTPEDTADDILRRADEALYEAKRAGKNRVVLARKQKSFWKNLVPFRD
jgi:diguanylate cyclase (GGDEF)-like protein